MRIRLCLLMVAVMELLAGQMNAATGSAALLSHPTSLLEKAIPSLPAGFRARPTDPWGHKMGEQTAAQFIAYYGPSWIPPGMLRGQGFLDAYSEFASGITHRKTDNITMSMVRLANESQAAQLTTYFEEAQTNGLTPAPGGGTVKRVRDSAIPGSQAYLSWFEGSADFDIVFSRGSVVVDLDRTTPSEAVASAFQRFADAMYAKLKIGKSSVT